MDDNNGSNLGGGGDNGGGVNNGDRNDDVNPAAGGVFATPIGSAKICREQHQRILYKIGPLVQCIESDK